jgi:hypothetical protein
MDISTLQKFAGLDGRLPIADARVKSYNASAYDACPSLLMGWGVPSIATETCKGDGKEYVCSLKTTNGVNVPIKVSKGTFDMFRNSKESYAATPDENGVYVESCVFSKDSPEEVYCFNARGKIVKAVPESILPFCTTRADLTAAFKAHDKNGDGVISSEEFVLTMNTN